MKTTLSLILALLFLFPAFSFAQGTTGSGTVCNGGTCTYTPLEPLPCPPGVSNCQSGNVEFNTFLSTLFRLLITLGGLFAVVMLVIAGIGYMVSESMGDIAKAKSRAKAALWGLLLLASCWLILNAINPKLLQFDLTSLGTLRTGLPSSGTPSPTPTNQSSSPTREQIQECERQGGTIKPIPGGFTCR